VGKIPPSAFRDEPTRSSYSHPIHSSRGLRCTERRRRVRLGRMTGRLCAETGEVEEEAAAGVLGHTTRKSANKTKRRTHKTSAEERGAISRRSWKGGGGGGSHGDVPRSGVTQDLHGGGTGSEGGGGESSYGWLRFGVSRCSRQSLRRVMSGPCHVESAEDKVLHEVHVRGAALPLPTDLPPQLQRAGPYAAPPLQLNLSTFDVRGCETTVGFTRFYGQIVQIVLGGSGHEYRGQPQLCRDGFSSTAKGTASHAPRRPFSAHLEHPSTFQDGMTCMGLLINRTIVQGKLQCV